MGVASLRAPARAAVVLYVVLVFVGHVVGVFTSAHSRSLNHPTRRVAGPSKERPFLSSPGAGPSKERPLLGSQGAGPSKERPLLSSPGAGPSKERPLLGSQSVG